MVEMNGCTATSAERYLTVPVMTRHIWMFTCLDGHVKDEGFFSISSRTAQATNFSSGVNRPITGT